MHLQRFGSKLEREFQLRLARNGRYSLRAFAGFLGTDHSTLSQIMRGLRRTPTGRIRAWSKKLGLPDEEAAIWIAAESLPDGPDPRSHWTAEAMCIVCEPEHWQILTLCGDAEFRPDSVWLAGRIGVSVDRVNVALSRLLRLGLLEMSKDAWTPLAADEGEFRKLALGRIRQKEVMA